MPTFEGNFHRDGAICVRNLFSPNEVKLVREAIEENLRALSPLGKRASAVDDGAFVEDFCNWRRISKLESFIRSSSVSHVAGQLMSEMKPTKTVRFYHDHILVKEAGTSQCTPFHQDLPYYNVRGTQNISMWMPVDEVSHYSALQFVAGSHHGPLYLPRSFQDMHAKWFPEGTLPELPMPLSPSDFDTTNELDMKILRWATKPGDAVFFHMKTIHGANGTDSTSRRRVLSLRFLGDDITFVKRPWVTSPPFEGLQLIDGERFEDDALFPVLWKNGP